MGAEYERKFLIQGDGWKSEVSTSFDIAQGYVAITERASVRVRLTPDGASVTIKSQAHEGIRRIETEMQLPMDEARELLETLAVSSVEKTRHVLKTTPLVWTVDVFDGANAGLVLLEVEGPADFQLDQLPDWVGREVTGDPRYVNSGLSEHPFGAWAVSESAGETT